MNLCRLRSLSRKLYRVDISIGFKTHKIVSVQRYYAMSFVEFSADKWSPARDVRKNASKMTVRSNVLTSKIMGVSNTVFRSL